MADRLYCIDGRIKMKAETIADHIFQEGVFDEKKDEKTLNFTISAIDRAADLRHGFRIGGNCGSDSTRLFILGGGRSQRGYCRRSGTGASSE